MVFSRLIAYCSVSNNLFRVDLILSLDRFLTMARKEIKGEWVFITQGNILTGRSFVPK